MVPLILISKRCLAAKFMGNQKGKFYRFYDCIEGALYALLLFSLIVAVLSVFFDIFTSTPHYLKERNDLLGFVFFVLDRSLLALMLLEILHTIKISLEGTLKLAIEPFLMIGIIASVRRILIISVEIAHPPNGCSPSADLFRQYMIETALLIVLVLTFVVGIVLLRKNQGPQKNP